MSKKRNKRAARNKAKGTPRTVAPEALAGMAREELERGRFREAITGFKALLKQADQPEWREGLARAYEGRARQLTDKNMLKEALVMWENRQRLGAAAPVCTDHAALLLRLGRIPEMLRLLTEAAPVLPPGELADLRARLAAHYLAGEASIAQGLPGDDPVVAHGEAAQLALSAYCRGDQATLEQALGAIPFRSPYRDWAQVLKALQRLPARPAEAAALLARIPDGSAFASLRQAAEIALVSEQELPARLAGAGEHGRRFGLTLRGWPTERQALYEELRALGEAPNPKALLQFLNRHRARLGEAWVHRRGMRLLIDGYPQSLRWLGESRGRSLSETERAQVAAWQAEQQRDPWTKLDHWEHLAALLEREAPPVPGSDQALRVALVLRRCEQASDLLAHATPSPDPEDLDRQVARLVETSLGHDPDDPDPYLRLADYYRRASDLKRARGLLEPALERWPQDLKVLTAALDTAVAGNAFKKAAGFARRILAIDPINHTARERLVNAHQAHARKQIRGGRLDLARRELETAAEWDPDGRLQDRRGVLEGLLTLSTDPPAGARALRALAEGLGPLTGRLVLAQEAVAIGRGPEAVLSAIGLAEPGVADPEDLSRFFTCLRAHLEGGAKLPREVSAHLEKALRAAARLPLSFRDLERACETLRLCRWDGPRLAFARAALKHWKGAPVFELHAFEAEHGAAPWRADDRAIGRLERALERAREAGDDRTAHRLAEQLEKSVGWPGPGAAPRHGPVSAAGGLEELIETVGLDQVLDLLGASRSLRREINEIEGEFGRDAAIELVAGLLAGELEAFGERLVPPGPPARSGRGAARDRERAGPAEPDETPDGDPFDQLNLFP